MKKITIIALHLGYGGIERCISNVANALCEDYQIEVVSVYKLYKEPIFSFHQKVKVTYLMETDLPLKLNKYRKLIGNKKYKGAMQALWSDYLKSFHLVRLLKDMVQGVYILGIGRKKAIKQYLLANESDLCIATHLFMYPIVGAFARGEKIGWEHNHHNQKQEYINAVADNSRYMEKLIVVSESLQMYYKEYFGKESIPCKVYSIPNFIDEIVDEESTPEEKRLIAVGRLSEEKGFLDLVDVMKVVVEKEPSAVLELIGDGPQLELLENKVKELELEENIFLHGFKDRKSVMKVLQQSSLAVMSSFTESFGLVLIEAMNYGIPCVAFSSAEGACDIITDGENGYLIEKRDKIKMADTIVRLLNEKNELKKLSKGAKETVQFYSKEKAVENWKEFIENECGREDRDGHC